MRNELRALLKPHGVLSVVVDRDENLYGEPAVGVKVRFRHLGQTQVGEFKFAKGNSMSIEHMAQVILSHIRNPDPGDEIA